MGDLGASPCKSFFWGSWQVFAKRQIDTLTANAWFTGSKEAEKQVGIFIYDFLLSTRMLIYLVNFALSLVLIQLIVYSFCYCFLLRYFAGCRDQYANWSSFRIHSYHSFPDRCLEPNTRCYHSARGMQLQAILFLQSLETILS